MTFLASRYQVRLKNQAGSQVALLDDWRTLQFQLKINTAGFFIFTINGNDDRVNLFEVDGQVEVYRSILGLLDWTLIFEGVIENFDTTLFENGNIQFMVVGSGYNGLLMRRIVAYNDGESEANKSDASETVMKEFVDENIGSSATVASGRLAEGAMSGFAVAVDTALGDTWDGDRAGKNLLVVLQEIGNFSGIDFTVVGTGAATYEFRTFADQLGIDRTTDGLDSTTGLNSAGNTPHTFSPENQNLSTIRYAIKRREAINKVFVYGQGAGVARDIEIRSDTDAINASPINLREAMRGGGSQPTAADLQALGDEWLERLQAEEIFSLAPLDTEASLYGVHYNFGDRVGVKFGTIERNKRLTSAIFTVTPGGETKQYEFSDIT